MSDNLPAKPDPKLPLLTPQREHFVIAYMRTGSASAAYREAFKVREGTKPNTIWAEASRLMANPKVSAWVEYLRKQARDDNLNSILLEFDQNRNGALDDRNWAAANGATRGKAQVLGLIPHDKDTALRGGTQINIIIATEDQVVL